MSAKHRILRDFETVSEHLVAKPESADKMVTYTRIAFSSSWVSLSLPLSLFFQYLSFFISPHNNYTGLAMYNVCVTQGERADIGEDGVKIEFYDNTSGIIISA